MALVVKNQSVNAGDIRIFLPGNPKDRGAWQTTVHGVTKSGTQLKCLSMHLTSMQTSFIYYPHNKYLFPILKWASNILGSLTCLQRVSYLYVTIEIRIPFKKLCAYKKVFPYGSVSKHSACSVGESWLGRFPGEENDNPLQYSCLENSWTEETDTTTFHGNESCLVMSNSL